MGIDGLALLIESGGSCTSFPGSIQVLLAAKFLPRELTDSYGINIRALHTETNQSHLPLEDAIATNDTVKFDLATVTSSAVEAGLCKHLMTKHVPRATPKLATPKLRAARVKLIKPHITRAGN
jgi:hypothetical protein